MTRAIGLAWLQLRRCRPRPPSGHLLSPRRKQSTVELSPAFALTQLLKDVRQTVRAADQLRLPFDQPVQPLLSTLDAAISQIDAPRPTLRVAVWGDRSSRAFELVNSLLHDPLRSDSSPDRVPGPHGALEIRYAPVPRSDPQNALLETPSACLRDYRIAILELTQPLALCPSRLPPCDIHLLVLPDQTHPPSELRPLIRTLAQSPTFYILLNSFSDTLLDPDGFVRALGTTIDPSLPHTSPAVMRINTFLASQALRTVSHHPSGPLQVDEEKLEESGFPSIREQILTLARFRGGLQTRTSITIGRWVLSEIHSVLLRVEEGLGDRQAKFHDFEIEIERISKLATQTLDVKLLLDGDARQRLPGFWELVGSSEVVGSSRDEKKLYQRLAFQAGQLSTLATQVKSTTEAFLSLLSPPTTTTTTKWVTELTKNEVNQALDRLPLTQTSVEVPGVVRLQGAFARLQSRAQQLVISGGLVGAGLGSILVANAIGRIIDSIAIGAAVVVLGAWKAQRDWGRAQANFIRDWSRSKATLEAELEERVREIVEDRLMAGPRHLIREGKKKIEEDREFNRTSVKNLEQLKKRLEEIEKRKL